MDSFGARAMRRYLLNEENLHCGNLILVNRDYPIFSSSNVSLESVSPCFPSILLAKEAKEALLRALEKIKAQEEIVFVSGYRILEEQREIFNTSLLESGEEFTLQYVALPNTSEHQTGLAIDLGLRMDHIDFIRPSFPHYGVCQKFREISYSFGLIERYSQLKKAITNISEEEWHFRYVGYPHSVIIKKHNFCLEEYILFLKKYLYPAKPLRFENYEVFYLPFGQMQEIEVDSHTEISGNNVDGFILTRKIS